VFWTAPCIGFGKRLVATDVLHLAMIPSDCERLPRNKDLCYCDYPQRALSSKSVVSISVIDMTDLRLFDLNLLVAFDALMAERNVTRAARRVGIGQPAMSYALSRLRELFADDLFTRTSGAMRPTTRALELSGPVGRVLADIREGVLTDRAFRPETAEVVFRVGATDYAEVAVIPAVLAALRSYAPNARLVVSVVDRELVSAMLETGAIDVAIAYFPDVKGAQKKEVLFHEEFVCLFDTTACSVNTPIKLKTFIDLPHILISLHGELSGAVDQVLARTRAKRFVFMATPHFLAIPFLLRGLRAVATVPRRLAECCAEVARLAVSPLPIEIDGFDVSMLWHARSDTDPPQLWFRDLIRAAGRPAAATSIPAGRGRRMKPRPLAIGVKGVSSRASPRRDK
jgi:DNA-binding transcriptional LysR family regulator